MGLKFRAESEVSSRVEQQGAPFLSRAHPYNDNRGRWGHWEKPRDETENNGGKKIGGTLKFTRVASSPFAIPPAPASSLEILCNGAGSSLFSKPWHFSFRRPIAHYYGTW